MRPQWYKIEDIPWKEMWIDDSIWYLILISNEWMNELRKVFYYYYYFNFFLIYLFILFFIYFFFIFYIIYFLFSAHFLGCRRCLPLRIQINLHLLTHSISTKITTSLRTLRRSNMLLCRLRDWTCSLSIRNRRRMSSRVLSNASVFTSRELPQLRLD
jgi:hypothetical protein